MQRKFDLSAFRDTGLLWTRGLLKLYKFSHRIIKRARLDFLLAPIPDIDSEGRYRNRPSSRRLECVPDR
jgi:hypothetical protein